MLLKQPPKEVINRVTFRKLLAACKTIEELHLLLRLSRRTTRDNIGTRNARIISAAQRAILDYSFMEPIDDIYIEGTPLRTVLNQKGRLSEVL